MALTATATISNDINYTLVDNGQSSQNESSSLGYSRGLANGTGDLQINYGVLQSGSLPSGGTLEFNLQSFEKRIFNATSNIQFSKVKSIVVENKETVFGWDINIHATGGTAWTEPWNGGSGNVLIKPYGVWQYSDPLVGAVVDASNRSFSLQDISGSGADYAIVVVGVTG